MVSEVKLELWIQMKLTVPFPRFWDFSETTAMTYEVWLVCCDLKSRLNMHVQDWTSAMNVGVWEWITTGRKDPVGLYQVLQV